VRVGYRLSKQEAKAAFASDVVFIEKFIEQPRHIEIQLIAGACCLGPALPPHRPCWRRVSAAQQALPHELARADAVRQPTGRLHAYM
jgi:hypothetical protein